MSAPWSRIVNSTTKNFIKKQEENVLRSRKLSALMKKKGRISFNWSGTEMQWPVRYKRVRMTPFGDGDTLEFSRKDRFKTANLGWRGYSSTDAMTKGEKLQNRNAQQIIDIYSNIAKELMDDMSEAFSEEFYVDGSLPQNSKKIHGIESFMQATTNAGNGAATPTGSFAGLSCVPGAYGGAWDGGPGFRTLTSNGWPNGRGEAHFDFWSPIIVDVGDALFDATTHTWKNNCVEAISFGLIKSKKSKSATGMLDVIISDDEMYRQYLQVLRTKERIEVARGKDQSALVSLGFTDVVNQDGTDITSEFGIVPGVAYGFNTDMMELRSQQAQLFVPEGPDYDLASKTWRYSLDFYGNMVWNPKFQVKWANLTNTSDAI